MGAVCAIKFLEMIESRKHSLKNQTEIKGLVLDSPFKSFTKLAIELGEKTSNLPRLMVKGFFHLLKANF